MGAKRKTIMSSSTSRAPASQTPSALAALLLRDTGVRGSPTATCSGSAKVTTLPSRYSNVRASRISTVQSHSFLLALATTVMFTLPGGSLSCKINSTIQHVANAIHHHSIIKLRSCSPLVISAFMGCSVTTYSCCGKLNTRYDFFLQFSTLHI